MIFGLGTKAKKKPTAAKAVKKSDFTKSKVVTKSSPKSSQANEAAEMLRKMEAKKDAGACPFC
jgi:hypothetical protein